MKIDHPPYFSVTDLEQWQHYRDRCPPWIKLHRDILNDYKYECLQDASKLHLIMIWLLASQLDNKVPFDKEWVGKRINAKTPVDLKLLLSKGFIYLNSVTLAGCEHVDIGETEAEAEAEAEAETEAEKQHCPVEPGPEEKVFEHWKQVMEHQRAVFGEKRRKAVKARLKEGYTVEDLYAAVEGCKKSPHHQGANKDGTVYDDLELICRDASHVDKFIKLAGQPNLVGLSASGRKTAANLANWTPGA